MDPAKSDTVKDQDIDWFATLPAKSADKVNEDAIEHEQMAQYAEEQRKHEQMAQYAEEERQHKQQMAKYAEDLARYAEEKRLHEQIMAQYAE
jgi:hypothetical protein